LLLLQSGEIEEKEEAQGDQIEESLDHEGSRDSRYMPPLSCASTLSIYFLLIHALPSLCTCLLISCTTYMAKILGQEKTAGCQGSTEDQHVCFF